MEFTRVVSLQTSNRSIPARLRGVTGVLKVLVRSLSRGILYGAGMEAVVRLLSTINLVQNAPSSGIFFVLSGTIYSGFFGGRDAYFASPEQATLEPRSIPRGAEAVRYALIGGSLALFWEVLAYLAVTLLGGTYANISRWSFTAAIVAYAIALADAAFGGRARR